MKLPIVEGPRPSNMFGLDDAGDRMDLGNIDYHHLVAERHPNLVLKSAYLKELENLDTFNISGVDGGK